MLTSQHKEGHDQGHVLLFILLPSGALSSLFFLDNLSSPLYNIIQRSVGRNNLIPCSAQFNFIRVWRSLVSRLVRVQEAVGSNPATRTMRSVLIGSEYPAKALRILFTSIATQNARLCGGLTIMSEHYEQLPHHREFSLTICFFYCIMLQVIWNKLCASVAQR